MSRVGRKPIPIAAGVKVAQSGQTVTIAGPKGQLVADVHPVISVEIKENAIRLSRPSDLKLHRSLHGLWRALLANMVRGVTEGYTRKLELVGVGYRAELKGKKLQLLLGFSHPILFAPPEGIKIETPTQNNITISGIDRALVGPGCREDPIVQAPRALQGKRGEVRGRVHPPEGRQGRRGQRGKGIMSSTGN